MLGLGWRGVKRGGRAAACRSSRYSPEPFRLARQESRVPRPVAPHPPLPEYYGDEAARPTWVRGIFDRTAADYDRIEALMSGGSGAWYRGEALARAGLARGIAARRLRARASLRACTCSTSRAAPGWSPPRRVIAWAARVRWWRWTPASACSPRGAIWKASCAWAARPSACRSPTRASTSRAWASRCATSPISPRCSASSGACCDPAGACACWRSPARAVASRPRRWAPTCAAARLFGRQAETATLMRYYWDTIAACVPPETVLEALRAAGFAEVDRRVELGIFSEYRARRPAA